MSSLTCKLARCISIKPILPQNSANCTFAFRQWSGIDAIIYYASNVFISLGLTGGTNALLATGVTGVVFLVSTIPAMVRF